MQLRILFFFIFLIVNLSVYGEQSIGIITCKVTGVGAWDPDSIDSGIAGSEEAVIYLSKHLSDLGYRVIVYGNPPKDSKYSSPDSNPRYLDIESLSNHTCDIAISWRMPAIGQALKKRASKVYLWPHDTLHSQLTADQIQAFDDIFWLSEWQRLQWISVNSEFEKYKTIVGNGIEPGQFKPITQRANPYSCIYGSNYARGLEILLEIWPEVKRQYPEASLDIYYGWQHWNLLTPEKEAKMRFLINKYAALSVVDHGKVGHEELNCAYERSSIWAYPCICPETFCITALRAQGSGVLPAIIEGTALSETVRAGFKCTTREEYLKTLIRAMKYAETMSLEEREQLSRFVFEEYTWKNIAERWHKAFRKDLETLPKVVLSR
jgi:glycosyltransferase involved in cell wall biosynthesis